jgi:hypothetical protein
MLSVLRISQIYLQNNIFLMSIAQKQESFEYFVI